MRKETWVQFKTVVEKCYRAANIYEIRDKNTGQPKKWLLNWGVNPMQELL